MGLGAPVSVRDALVVHAGCARLPGAQCCAAPCADTGMRGTGLGAHVSAQCALVVLLAGREQLERVLHLPVMRSLQDFLLCSKARCQGAGFRLYGWTLNSIRPSCLALRVAVRGSTAQMPRTCRRWRRATSASRLAPRAPLRPRRRGVPKGRGPHAAALCPAMPSLAGGLLPRTGC